MSVPRSAAPGGAAIGSSGVELQDVARIDRIGVAHQRLDLGDAERCAGTAPGRAAAPGARSGGAGAASSSAAREAAAARSPRSTRRAQTVVADEGLEALQEARRHRRRAAALCGARDHHVRRAERLDEIVRRLADAPLRRRQAERGAHRPVEEGVGLVARRPDALVEPAEHDAVDVEEARFEQARGSSTRAMRRARRGLTRARAASVAKKAG